MENVYGMHNYTKIRKKVKNPTFQIDFIQDCAIKFYSSFYCLLKK